MSHEPKMTKRDARRVMQQLMKERDKRTSTHPEPSWVRDFWATRRSMLS